MAYSTYNPQLEEIANSGGIGAFLKGIAPAALGIAGNLIAPGIGGMIGSSVGGMVQQLEQGGQLPLNEFNGLLHEQGGININAAEVEDGETSVKDYVFSDNLMIPGTKRTFAQESKRIDKRYSKRPYDRHATKSKERELQQLAQQQEQLKAEEQAASNPIAQGQETMSPEGMPIMADGGLMAAGYGLQALSNLPSLIQSFKKPEQVNYGRVKAPEIDLSSQRSIASNQRTAARNAALRSAQRLDNPYGAMTSVNTMSDPYAEFISKSYSDEANQNAQLAYDASKTNAQIRMQETEANQKNKDAQRSMQHQALANIGQVAATGISDYMGNKQATEQMALSKEYYDWLMNKKPTNTTQAPYSPEMLTPLLDRYKNIGIIPGTKSATQPSQPQLNTATSSYSLPEGNYPAPTTGSLVFTTDGKFIRQADGSLVPAMKCGGKLPKRSYRRKK